MELSSHYPSIRTHSEHLQYPTVAYGFPTPRSTLCVLIVFGGVWIFGTTVVLPARSAINSILLGTPYTSLLLFPSNNGDAMECREWILFWNKVDQLWELEEGYVSKAHPYPVQDCDRFATRMACAWSAPRVRCVGVGNG